MRNDAWQPNSRPPDCGSCARSRRPAPSRPPHTRLGYTQSAVSRQVAALEAVVGAAGCSSAAGTGVTLTPAGARLLPRAIRILDELDAARREAAGEPVAAGPVRLGAFATAAAGLVPEGARVAAAGARRSRCARAPRPRSPEPSARARSTSAILARTPPYRPPGRRDSRARSSPRCPSASWSSACPPTTRSPARERSRSSSSSGRSGSRRRSDTAEPLLGVWPGLTERPDVRYVVRDWLAKLQIVAAGLAITTLAPVTLDVLPGNVKAVAVRGEPQETRRIVLARLPGPLDPPAARVSDALLAAAAALPRSGPRPTRGASSSGRRR